MAFFMSPRGTLLGSGSDPTSRRAGAQLSGVMKGSLAQFRGYMDAVRGQVHSAVKELVMRQKSAYVPLWGGHYTHGGRAWKLLAPSTLKRKMRQGSSLNILVEDGSLRDSIKGYNPKVKKTPRGVSYTIKIEATSPIGRFHATGFNNARTGSFVAPRPPVEITAGDVQFVAENIRNALSKVR